MYSAKERISCWPSAWTQRSKNASLRWPKNGRTKTFYAREAILNYLEDMEDAFIADKAMAAFEKSGRKTASLSDVMKEYGLDD
jgi:RHH-type transcriptional regulator, rel operon repressor / antitoxin RelB